MESTSDDARALFDRLGADRIEGLLRVMAPGVDWLAMWRRGDDEATGDGRTAVRQMRNGICSPAVAEARLA